MQLLLIRHAIAQDREDFAGSGRPDSERPLTAFGKRRMRRNAAGLAVVAPAVEQLVSSPYVRARATAAIIAKALGVATTVTHESLVHDAHPREFMAWLAKCGGDAVVAAVGHEPQLSLLVGWALSREATSTVEFKKGGACVIAFDGKAAAGAGRLQWLFMPAQLRALAQ